jgi:hypothetical protein
MFFLIAKAFNLMGTFVGFLRKYKKKLEGWSINEENEDGF